MSFIRPRPVRDNPFPQMPGTSSPQILPEDAARHRINVDTATKGVVMTEGTMTEGTMTEGIRPGVSRRVR